jgi:hypothetical protein
MIITRFRYFLTVTLMLFCFSCCVQSQFIRRRQSESLDFAGVMRAFGVDTSTNQTTRFIAPIATYRDMTPFLYRSNDLNRILSTEEMCRTQKILLPPDSKQYRYYSGGIKEACLDTVPISFLSPILANELTKEKYLQILDFYSDSSYRVVSDRTWVVDLDKSGCISIKREIESYLNMDVWPQGQLPPDHWWRWW